MVDPLSVAGSIASLVQLAKAYVGEPGWAERLAKKVADVLEKQEGFSVSRRALQRWLESEAGWDLLVKLDPSLLPAIADATSDAVVRATRKGKKLDGDEVERRSRLLAHRLHAQFLAALDASYGIAVLHRRIEALLVQPAESLDPFTRGLPPNVWGPLADVRNTAPELGSKLGLFLQDHSRQPQRVAQIISEDGGPDWLEGAPYQVWTAIGAFLGAHEISGATTRALRQAVEAGAPDADYLLARAAIHEHDRSEEAARELLDQSDRVEGHLAAISKAVRAALEGRPQDVLTQLETLDSVHLPTSPEVGIFVAALRIDALGSVGETEAAVELSRATIDEHPARASFSVMLADHLIRLAGALPVGHSDRGRLLAEAADALSSAIGLRDSWRGPTEDLVAKVCGLRMAIGDLEGVVDAGLASAQSSVSEEQQASRVRVTVTLALIGLGRLKDARALVTRGSPFAIAYLYAAEAQGDGAEAANRLFAAALEEAETPQERALVLLALANRGEKDLAGIEEIREMSAEWAAYIEARSALARSDCDTARRLTAPYHARSGPHAQLTAESYRLEGNTDEAVRVLVDCSEALRSAELASEAVGTLVEAGRTDEAERLGLATLARYPGQRPARKRIRQQLLAMAEQRRDWITFTDQATALVAEFPEDPGAQWAHIFGFAARRRWGQAWSAYEEAGEPDAIDAQLAALKIDLESRFRATPESVKDAIDLAAEYPEAEGVVGGAVHAAFIRAREIELPDDTRQASQELFTGFLKQFPESDLVRQIPIDPDNPAEHLRALLKPRAAVYDDVAEKIQFGQLPYGFGSEALGHAYTSWLVQYRARGVICAATADVTLQELEKDAALEALGREVSVDTSIFVVALRAGTDQLWQLDYLGGFQLADVLLDDGHAAMDEAGAATTDTIGWDIVEDRPNLSKTSDDQLQELRSRTERLVALLERNCRVVNTSTMPPIGEDIEPGDFEPWMASLRLALARDLPLYADDLALRHLARSVGISAFGTQSLVAAAAESGVIDSDEAEKRVRELVAVFVVDAPFDGARLASLAEESDFAPGPAATALSRPSAWIDPEIALGFYRSLVAHLGDAGRIDAIPPWLVAASVGAALRAQPTKRPEVLGMLLASTILNAGLDPANVPVLVQASREAARYHLRLPDVDPLEDAVLVLKKIFTGVFVEAEVASAVLWVFRHLSDGDRRRVVGRLLTV